MNLRFKKFPRRLFVAAVVFLFHSACYILSSRIVGWLGLPLHSVALPIDAGIPLIPLFAIPYIAWFAYLPIGYYLMAVDRERIQRFATAIFLGAITCFVIYLLYPTYIDWPTIPEGGLSNFLLQIVYWFDSPPRNLFPSLHVFIVWLFFIYARVRRPVRPWLIVFTLGFALLTCAAVLFTRQHFLVDIPAAILLAELCWVLSRWKGLQRLTDWFWNWVYQDKTI